jgi:hypothetical protein
MNAEVKEKPKLKLFVVGEFSSDPDEWSENGGYSIVLAANEEEARQASCSPGPAIEVVAKRPCELAFIRSREL